MQFSTFQKPTHDVQSPFIHASLKRSAWCENEKKKTQILTLLFCKTLYKYCLLHTIQLGRFPWNLLQIWLKLVSSKHTFDQFYQAMPPKTWNSQQQIKQEFKASFMKLSGFTVYLLAGAQQIMFHITYK